MEDINLPKKEILEILKQLKYCCDEFELYVEDGGEVKIMIGDIDPRSLKRTENLYNIAGYLRKNGLDFFITFDLINDISDMYIDEQHPSEDFIQLGIIKGENIQSINTKIEELIHKLSSEEATSNREEKKGQQKMYSDNREEIILRTLGIKIKGNCIFVKKLVNNKKVFDPTEEALIYFLYFKFLKNKEECFSIQTLAKELKTSEGHLKNRMTNIHKIIRKTISENRAIRDNLIKNTFGRGYRLNPRLFK